ncbi:MAG: hypothetical protein J1E85_02955 [Ruminococcus sp.]|nr:hypothetical protein [Ruminococcus sp.]
MKKFVSCIMALMLVMFAAIPAFAATDDIKSPEGDLRYKVTVEQTTGGKGSYEFTSDINEKGEQGVSLTATAEPGYKFDHWVINGSYTTDGSLNDATLNIIITSDIVATPYFVKIDGTEPTQAGTTVAVQKDTSPSSPKTGRNDAPLYAIILFAVAACGVATVKFVKSK